MTDEEKAQADQVNQVDEQQPPPIMPTDWNTPEGAAYVQSVYDAIPVHPQPSIYDTVEQGLGISPEHILAQPHWDPSIEKLEARARQVSVKKKTPRRIPRTRKR